MRWCPKRVLFFITKHYPAHQQYYTYDPRDKTYRTWTEWYKGLICGGATVQSVQKHLKHGSYIQIPKPKDHPQ